MGLFFEVFLLLTFFDAEAKHRRSVKTLKNFPTVSIVVPCYNEAKTVARTIASLRALDYPKEKLSLILVNDGSTDGTRAILDRYASQPRMRVIHKENGGKHTALNAGIAATESEFVGGLDADSFVSPEALKEIIPHFDTEKVGAVVAAISIWRPKTLLEKVQQTEYLLSIMFRHAISAINGLYVTPGPFSVYRRKVFEELGGFVSAHNTEDMEMALRLQKANWRIANAPRARVYTTGVRAIPALLRQRMRWVSGFVRNGIDYRELYGNPRYGALGMLVLPFGTVSILGTVFLFALFWIDSARYLADAFERTTAVPLSFAFRAPRFQFDWFYLPASSILFVGLITCIIMFVRMKTGSVVSKTKLSVGSGALLYLPVLSIIAPIWIVWALIDVWLGIKRPWR